MGNFDWEHEKVLKPDLYNQRCEDEDIFCELCGNSRPGHQQLCPTCVGNQDTQRRKDALIREAAPALLEALEGCMNQLITAGIKLKHAGLMDHSSDCIVRAENARDVIAKATNKQ